MSDRRASKPPFYRNVLVRHPVNPLLPLPAGERARLARMEPCLIMGRGHSGTRVIAWMCHHLGVSLGTDPSVPSGDPADRSFKHHQRVVATRAVARSVARPIGSLEMNRFQRSVAAFHRRIGSPERWGWKFPESYLLGPHIAHTFPRARYVHLLRDGRDVAFKRHLTDVSEHRLARAILRRKGALDLPHHLQAALSWEFQVEAFERFREQVDGDSILDLRYEDVVRAPVAAVERIAGFLSIPVTDAARAFAGTEVHPAHAGSVPAHDAERLAQVEERIGPTLRAAGYDVPARATGAGA